MIALTGVLTGARRMPTWAWALIGAALLLLALWAYGRDQYNDGHKEGRAHEAALWEAAERKLLEKAAEAKTQADKQAAARAADYAADVAVEKQQIDAAVQNGASPFDVMFGEDR